MEMQEAVLNTSGCSDHTHHCWWQEGSLELTPVWEQTDNSLELPMGIDAKMVYN